MSIGEILRGLEVGSATNIPAERYGTILTTIQRRQTATAKRERYSTKANGEVITVTRTA